MRASAGDEKIWSGVPSSRIAPGVEEAHPVGDVPGKAHLVGCDDHRHPPGGQLANHAQDLGHELRVKGAGDLVEEHQPGLHGQGANDRDPLLLAAGQAIRVLVALVGQAEAGE